MDGIKKHIICRHTDTPTLHCSSQQPLSLLWVFYIYNIYNPLLFYLYNIYNSTRLEHFLNCALRLNKQEIYRSVLPSINIDCSGAAVVLQSCCRAAAGCSYHTNIRQILGVKYFHVTRCRAEFSRDISQYFLFYTKIPEMGVVSDIF